MSSSSSISEVSTAPSSPLPMEIHTSYLVLGNAGLLSGVSDKINEEDTILFLTGTGTCNEVAALMDQANEVLDVDIAKRRWDDEMLGGSGVCFRSNSEYIPTAEGTTHIDVTALSVASDDIPPEIALTLFTEAHLRALIALSSPLPSSTLRLYVLTRPPFVFPALSALRPAPLNPTATHFGIPSAQEFRDLWKAWDCVTLGMIPRAMLHEKPIDLRHKCLFYLGHIPTFLDMLLSNLLNEPNTEPKRFTMIFERGIDPHVDDPEHCHRHSEVPTKDEDWPSLTEVLEFRDRVRARVLRLFEDLESGTRTITRRIARVLVMTLEHEGFHIETLLYMLIQRAGTGTLPPPGFTPPPFAALAKQWATYTPPATPTVTLGPAQLVLGHDDPESHDLLPSLAGDVFGRAYGWDNESPARTVAVGAFRVEWRPVTNGEYETWWRAEGARRPPPPSWVVHGPEARVRTFFGNVGMDVARHWPVMAAYDDLRDYARAKGGRIPTESELRLFLDTYEVGYEGGANVGFRNWHCVPATAGGEKDGGRGSNGGVWEWTSDLFETHDGFDPTTIFPGYSTDFFDTKHHVVLGASYATIPRLAGRRTVRNFYQHNYPYPWVGARVAYDI